FLFSSRRRHTRSKRDWSSDVCSSDLGPYSQAIEAGDFIYVSGQIPVEPATGEVVEGIEEQTHQVLKNLKAILTEAGATFSQVVKFTIYLASIEDFATVNEIYGSYLEKPYPARARSEEH